MNARHVRPYRIRHPQTHWERWLDALDKETGRPGVCRKCGRRTQAKALLCKHEHACAARQRNNAAGRIAEWLRPRPVGANWFSEVA